MKQSSLMIDKSHLRLLVEMRQDDLGKVCFFVTFSSHTIRFRSLESVNDFIVMNLNSVGYVE